MTKIIWRTNLIIPLLQFVRNKKKNMCFYYDKNTCFLKGCLLFYTCYLTDKMEWILHLADKLEFAIDLQTANYPESDSL